MKRKERKFTSAPFYMCQKNSQNQHGNEGGGRGETAVDCALIADKITGNDRLEKTRFLKKEAQAGKNEQISLEYSAICCMVTVK